MENIKLFYLTEGKNCNLYFLPYLPLRAVQQNEGGQGRIFHPLCPDRLVNLCYFFYTVFRQTLNENFL